ncbi:flagellar biosynthetic protein FliR [Massilia agilis]|uniref:Flagellar biosynthetic protein FliR n=1 Tax=Massilia agilis TaxID=1811226 RepID=A0ABT2D7V5_9BURK|nr:flagellar biosynthetic protein FliR [Massilia agilis]MCS0807397.1 flagellar biosynthetic protein FliR [Massilia agilis]
MISFTSVQLNAWMAAFLWPLTRILGLVAAAPVFGNTAIPVTVKVSLGALITLVVAPTLPPMPAIDPGSWAGLLILLQQLVVGLAMGFAMRLVFAAIELAGEVASLTMGLGFATFFDPSSSGRSSAISQFLALVSMMAFLAVNAHLALLSALVESFFTLPVGGPPFGANGPLELARWGARVFSAGFQLSLPIVAALLITNVALGILTRAAPQLNLFGIGFPVTLGVGLLVISLVLPYLGTPIVNLFNQGIEESRAIPRASQTKAPAQAAIPALSGAKAPVAP